MPRILRRVWGNLWQHRKPLISLVANLSSRGKIRLNCKAYADFKRQRGQQARLSKGSVRKIECRAQDKSNQIYRS